MQVVIQIADADQDKAMPIILRRSPGVMLRDRIYILSGEVAKELRASGVEFQIIARQPTNRPTLNDLHGRIL